MDTIYSVLCYLHLTVPVDTYIFLYRQYTCFLIIKITYVIRR